MPAPTRVLPALVYDKKTRVSGEFYLYFNLGLSFKYGAIGVTAPSTGEFRSEPSCGAENDPPASAVYAVRAKTAIQSEDITFTVQGATATIPAYSPPGQAAELSSSITNPVDQADIGVSGGLAGDSVDIIALPGPAGDVLVCYDQGFNAEETDENRPIPRKFEAADHYVRQRSTNTITLAELYTCNVQGLASLRARDCVLIGRFYPDGGAVPSEILYYTGVRLNVPKEVPQEANDSVQVNATGTFRESLVFTAPVV